MIICEGGPETVEEWGGEFTFSPTNSSKDHLDAEQLLQNHFWTLAEDTRRPERQPILFKRRKDKIWKTKRETEELGMETGPGEAVMKEKFLHSRKLSQARLWRVLESQKAT